MATTYSSAAGYTIPVSADLEPTHSNPVKRCSKVMKQETRSTTDTNQTHPQAPRGKAGWFTLAGVGVCIVCAGGVLFVWRSSGSTTYVVPDGPPPVTVGAASFQVNTEAEKYRSALTQGQRRSIDVLEQALEQVRSQQTPNQELVRQLEAQLQTRKAQLQAATLPAD